MVGSASRQYPDAFTFQKVSEDEVNHFNYVAGMIPFIKELTDRVSMSNYHILLSNIVIMYDIIQARLLPDILYHI